MVWISGAKPTDKCFFSRDGESYFGVDSNTIISTERGIRTAIPYSDLLVEDKPTRSRLSEILGVEDDEEWRYKGEPYRISAGRRQWKCAAGGWEDCANEGDLSRIICQKDLIIRKPRFTEDELAMLRCFAAAGVKQVCRNAVGISFHADAGITFAWPLDMFPSIRTGESVELSEVLK